MIAENICSFQEKKCEVVWGFLFLSVFSYKKTADTSAVFVFGLKETGNKDFETDDDQDRAAEDTRLA